MKGIAEANRLNASGVASKECVLRVHLVPALGATSRWITTQSVRLESGGGRKLHRPRDVCGSVV